MVPHRPVVRPSQPFALFLLAFFGLVISHPRSVFAEDHTVTLDEAYTRARARSAEILAAHEKVVEAEINLDRAWALLKPTWNASFTYTHVEPSPPSLELPPFPNLRSQAILDACQDANGDGTADDAIACGQAIIDAFRTAIQSEPTRFDFFQQNTALFNTTVTWNIFNGRAFPLIADAKDSIVLEETRHVGAMLDLLLTVARAYYSAAATKEAIAAADRARERAKSELAIAEKQLELGETVRGRQTAAKSAFTQTEIDVRRAHVAHAQALLALYALTRSDDRPEVAPPPVPERPIGETDALIARAFEDREDLRTAALAIAIAERGDDEAWWRFAPTISLFGGFRYSNVAGISGQTEQWSAGVLATLLLYDGGLRYADLRTAESRLRAAQLAHESVRTRVKTDVERAELGVQSAELGVDRAHEALVLAKERSSVTAAQYEVGALRTIELQQASDAVLDAELAIIRAEMERSLAIIELQRAIGAFKP